jgi:hypothetical protein
LTCRARTVPVAPVEAAHALSLWTDRHPNRTPEPARSSGDQLDEPAESYDAMNTGKKRSIVPAALLAPAAATAFSKLLGSSRTIRSLRKRT